MKKIMAALMMSILLLTTLSACSSDQYKLNVDGKQTSVPYVMKIGKYKIGLDEYRYYYLNVKNQVAMGDEKYFDSEKNQAALKQKVEETILQSYQILLLADKYKIELNKEEKQKVKDDVQAYKNQFKNGNGNVDKEAMKKDLDSKYLTEDIYARYTEYQAIADKIMTALFAEGTEYEAKEENIIKYLKNDFVRVKHVLVSNETKNAEKVATNVQKKAKSGEKFEDLVKKYNEDPGVSSNPNGYVFSTGQMQKEFEEVSFKLKDNEVSGLVKTSYGYHIIKRYTLDETYIKKNLNELTNSYKQGIYYRLMNDVKKDIKIEYHDKAELISPTTLK